MEVLSRTSTSKSFRIYALVVGRATMIAEYDDATFPGTLNARFDKYGLQNYLSSNTDIVYLGDVFMKGYAPPDFVGTVLVLDKDKQVCPSGTGILGIPCFARPDSPDVDPTKQYVQKCF